MSRLSLASNLTMNVGKMQMHAAHATVLRNASSLSTELLDLKFDSCSLSKLTDEPPLSPEIIYSPNSSPNGSLYGRERALMASRHNQFSPEKGTHASSWVKYEEQQGVDDPPLSPVPRISADQVEKKRVNLRSLLNRRDLDQLSPLTNHPFTSSYQVYSKDLKKQVPLKVTSPASTISTSSPSPSSSPTCRHAHYYTNPWKFEDHQPDYDSHTECKGSQTKRKRWVWKLGFFRKGSNARAERVLNQSGNAQQADGSVNYRENTISAAAKEAERMDDYPHHEKAHDAAATREAGDYHHFHRIEHYSAAEAAGEAWFNHHTHPSIANSRGMAAAAWKSASGGTPSGRSSPVNHRSGNSKSAPISPAASPPPKSLPAEERTLTPGRAPMSPHAVLYEQQRARAEELRRKTMLPYRHSVIGGACFQLPLSQAVH